MTANHPGQITHLPVPRRRDTEQERALKDSLRLRLLARGIRIRRDVAAWMTVAELQAIWRAAINATDRYVAERYDYEDVTG